MSQLGRIALCSLVLVAGCGGGDGGDDGGTDLDAPSGSCSGADGTPCGTDQICVARVCAASRCGDGFTDTGRGEACDDGNATAFDGCEPGTCQFTCNAPTDCDDGATCNGVEECSATHQCTAGTPAADGSACDLAGGGAGVCRTGDCVVEGCGDGLVTGDEHCDDGNGTDGDGCESDCRFTCEVDTTTTNTWYVDCDGDSYAEDGAATQMVCLEPAPSGCGGGWTVRAPVAGARDCDDAQGEVHPGATEVCDGVDQDCDTMIDDGVLMTFYRDADGDSHGDAGTTMMACAAPTGFVTSSDDCNDACATCFPGGTETCDLADNNCNGSVDEGVLNTFYRDTDGDTYGSTSTIEACTAPAGYVNRGGDCDDGDSGAFPGQTTYFTRARTGGGYDFNCDGSSSRQYTSIAPSSCSGCACPVGFCCAGMCAGWVSTVPSCGGSGTWRETDCTCGFPSSPRAQGCR